MSQDELERQAARALARAKARLLREVLGDMKLIWRAVKAQLSGRGA